MKLFLSAASADFKSCRTALAQALESRGIQAEYQEQFPPDYGDIHRVLSDKIRGCDAVACLIGPSYGGAPVNQPFEPRRSYTQLEYYIARELQKPTYLFLAKPDFCFDSQPKGSSQELELQKQFAGQFLRQGQFVYEFGDRNELLHLLGGAVHRLSLYQSLGSLGQQAERNYPTPLATLLLDCVEADATKLGFAAILFLRFAALLAAHDAIVHGLFAVESAEPLTQFNLLSRRMRPRDWQRLLRLACPSGSTAGRRFIPEFAGWEQRQSNCINRVVEILDSLSTNRFDDACEPDFMTVDELQKCLMTLYTSLDFLQRYALAARQTLADGGGEWRVFRGVYPQDVPLRSTDDCAATKHPETLWLLRFDRRRALCLTPAFWRRPTASLADLWGVAELCLRSETDGQINIRPFEQQTKSVQLKLVREKSLEDSETVCFAEVPTAWRQLALGQEMTSGDEPVEGQEIGLRMFSDDDWEKLQSVALPPEPHDPRVGEFHCIGDAAHRGRFADIFEAFHDPSAKQPSPESTPTLTSKLALHRLRKEHVKSVEVLDWFARRAALWNQLHHPRVLKVHPSSNPAGNNSMSPNFACPFIPGGHTLEHELNERGSLAEDDIEKILSLAAEVCLAAARQNLRILSLPLRHFLSDGAGGWWLTGFETLLPANCSQWCLADAIPLDHVKRWSSEWMLVAPEIACPLRYLAETVDVYALGALLCRLRGTAGAVQPMEYLPTSAWRDPWQCLTFHCLAALPEMRLQSVEHFQRLLAHRRSLSPHDGHDVPSLTGLLTLSARAGQKTECKFRIAEFPVTNSQFAWFCQQTGRPLPLHLCGQASENHPYHRLGGPWCPVVFVNLEDAEAYARWLSYDSCHDWRLPADAHWRHAARPNDSAPYPWGYEPPDEGRANFGTVFRGPTVVGAFPAGRAMSGCYDLAGNVWEWCTDRIYNGVPLRLLKGGAYDFSAESLDVRNHESSLILRRSAHVGFRVLCQGSET